MRGSPLVCKVTTYYAGVHPHRLRNCSAFMLGGRAPSFLDRLISSGVHSGSSGGGSRSTPTRMFECVWHGVRLTVKNKNRGVNFFSLGHTRFPPFPFSVSPAYAGCPPFIVRKYNIMKQSDEERIRGKILATSMRHHPRKNFRRSDKRPVQRLMVTCVSMMSSLFDVVAIV